MNAIRVLHAIGGSTNAVIHLLAIAYEMGFEKEINLELFEKLGQETPCITAVRPSGPYTMGDFDEAGGIQAVMKKIEKFLDKEASTVTGETLGDNLNKIRRQGFPCDQRLLNTRSIEEGWPSSGGTLPRLPWSGLPSSQKRCFSIEAGQRCLMGKKRPWKPCSRTRFSRAMLSSFDMRAPGAVPVLQRSLRSLVI